MGKTAIPWAELGWGIVVGCTHAGSPACDHCWARSLHNKRHQAFLAGQKMPPQYQVPFDTVQVMEQRMHEPLTWKRPRVVFVAPMGDLFHEAVPDLFLHKVFHIMRQAAQHEFLLLTKRPERMRQFIKDALGGDVPPNCWGGVTIENQAAANQRLPVLLDTPFINRFASIEPLLGAIDLRHIQIPGGVTDALGGWYGEGGARLNYVIIGGETGPGARPMRAEWVRSLKKQVEDTSTTWFFKSWGDFLPFERLRRDDCTCYWRAADGRELAEKDILNLPHEIDGDIGTVRVGHRSAGYLIDGATYRYSPFLPF